MKKLLEIQSGYLDIYIEDNVDYSFNTIYQIDDITQDVTGFTANLHIRDNPGQSDPPILSLSDAGGIIVGSSDGLFKTTITDTQAVFGDREMWYDLIINNLAGKRIKLLRGKCISKASTTT